MKNCVFILLISLLVCCSSQRKILYLQNQEIGKEIEILQEGNIKLLPGDIISITVSSKDAELSSIFNLIKPSFGNSTVQYLDYTISPEGYIDFPILGELKIEGMTKSELTNFIKTKITESKMLNEPIVTVEFINLSFYTLGEVNSPGKFMLEKDKTTIFDALSTSGDLTIYGLRDRVFVSRRNGDKIITYKLNLTDKNIFLSPAFYIQQNDVIYIEPSKTRSNQSTANGNSLNTVSFWTSLASFLTTITLLFVNL
ncbi:MAG: polysaccharide biosynthesis/export family protein [Rikenellaceae bacterium]